MAGDLFIDTSGLYAFMAPRDECHDEARTRLRGVLKRRGRVWTTDYVLDETVTLLKARDLSHLLTDFFDAVLSSRLCEIEWMDSERFGETRAFCLKHRDQSWSFTDCFSFLVMRHRRLRDALTKDSDFRAAGFDALLAS